MVVLITAHSGHDMVVLTTACSGHDMVVHDMVVTCTGSQQLELHDPNMYKIKPVSITAQLGEQGLVEGPLRSHCR